MKVSVEVILDQMKEAVEEVFSTMLDTVAELVERGDCTHSNPQNAGSEVEQTPVAIEAVVDFIGDPTGSVILRATAQGALDIARKLLMAEDDEAIDLEEVQDALGECANMVTGALKTRVLDPEGQFDLSIRYKSEQDGFSFAQNGYVRADGEPNDLYFYAKDGQDYLASPERLGFLRTTRFRTLPYKGELADVTSRLTAEALPSDDRVRVKKGDWVEVMTEDKTFALIKVVDIVGDGDNRRLNLQYAFSPAVGAPLF